MRTCGEQRAKRVGVGWKLASPAMDSLPDKLGIQSQCKGRVKNEVGDTEDRDGESIDRGKFKVAHSVQRKRQAVKKVRDPADEGNEALFPPAKSEASRGL